MLVTIAVILAVLFYFSRLFYFVLFWPSIVIVLASHLPGIIPSSLLPMSLFIIPPCLSWSTSFGSSRECLLLENSSSFYQVLANVQNFFPPHIACLIFFFSILFFSGIFFLFKKCFLIVDTQCSLNLCGTAKWPSHIHAYTCFFFVVSFIVF